MWADLGHEALCLDPGWTMLRAAAQRPGVRAVAGRAQDMPFRDESMALVYFHLSLHYGDWRGSLREAARVLRRGGACVVWTLGARHHRSSMLARWFPSVADIDAARFPEPDRVIRDLRDRHLAVTAGVQTERVERPAGEWVRAVRAGFVSTLQLLSADELRAGLDAFEQAHPDPLSPVRYELRWDWIRAVRPSA